MKQKIKLILIFFIIMPIIAVFTGCGEESGSQNSQTINVIIPYPVTVQGFEFESAPTTIASLSPVLTKLIRDFGYSEKIVAVTEGETAQPGNEDLLNIGSPMFPDIDKIIESAPDMLILDHSLPKADMDKLYLKNIKVLIFEMPKSLDDIRNIYMNLGVIFTGAISNMSAERGIPRDEKFLGEYQKIKDAYDDITARIGESKKSYMWIKSADGMLLTGDSPQNSLLSLIAVNIAESGKMYTVDLAEMEKKTPAHAFLEEPLDIPEIVNSETWANFSAVTSGDITNISPDAFRYIYSGDMVPDLYMFAKALYSEKFEDVDLTSYIISSSE